MKIDFLGAAGCVTGSCFKIEYADKKFLVECGMFQGSKTLKENNYGDFSFTPSEIDFVLVTHAHIDHTGLLPKLVKHGFKGEIFCTEPTSELLRFMLPDSAKIQEFEVVQKNHRNRRKGLPDISPIYEIADAEETIGRLRGMPKGEAFSPAPGCTVKFRNAGHVLGSAFIEISLGEGKKSRKIVFSGDVGERDHPIVKDPENFEAADYLVVESTYGNRVRSPQDKEGRLEQFTQIFKQTLKAGGNLIIPSFALERTQDIMHDISVLMRDGKIPETDIIVDSPLAINLTKVFHAHPDSYDEDARELIRTQGSLFEHPRFRFTLSPEESMALNGKTGQVIISASGMCDAGRIKHHLKHNLWRPASTILFVGYQAPGTLGRIIRDGAKAVRIHGEEIKVEAQIKSIPGYSGHADRDGILRWISESGKISSRVFVVHGEEDAAMEMSGLINRISGVDTVCPGIGDSYDLLDTSIVSIEPHHHPAPVDSHNLFADVMVKVAQFMRSSTQEEKKRQTLSKLLEIMKE